MLARCELTDSGCWEFKGAVTSRGYGSVGAGGRSKSALAHRVSWEAHRGPIPKGMTVDHLCHNKRCLNPDHMELVPGAVNSARGSGRSSLYCRNGHPLFGTLGKWIRRSDGKRSCRVCAPSAASVARSSAKLAVKRKANRDAYNAQQREQYARRVAAKNSPADVAFERQHNGGNVMTEQEGRGVHTLSQLVKQLSRMNPAKARQIIDEVDNEEIADVLSACSAAAVAQDGEVARDAFDESVARRLSETEAIR